MTTNAIITLTGPSCAGKSTLASLLTEKDAYTEIISTTTRKPRAGEVNGLNYYFVTSEEFDAIPMVESTEFSGMKYGGSVAEFERHFASGKIPVIVVDPVGADAIEKQAAQRGWVHLKVFVDAPMELLVRRNLERFAYNWRTWAGENDFNFDYAVDEEKFLTTYAKRFLNLINEERFWLTKHCWDVIIPEFVANNQELVIQHLEKCLQQKLPK